MVDPQSLDLRLIVKRHGLILDERPVDKEQISIGRDPECDIVLEDPAASRRVADFRLEDDGLWVVDAGSLGGIRIDGEAVDRRRLRPGDEVEIGSFTLEVHGSAEALSASEATVVVGAPATSEETIVLGADEEDRTVVLGAGPPPAPVLIMPDDTRLELDDGVTVLGRSGESDILLDSTAASKRHAELRVEGGVVTIVDLGSTNGSRVNGELVDERRLEDGDEIELADVTLTVEIAREAAARSALEDKTILVGADVEEGEVREQAAAIVRDKIKVEAPGGRRRLLLIALGSVAAVVFLLVAISVIIPDRAEPVGVEDPGDVPAEVDPSELVQQGFQQYEGGEVHDALDLWEQALELDPTNFDVRDRYAQTLYRVGLIYEGNGQVDSALDAWRRLVDHVTDAEHAYVVRARAKLRKYE